MTDVAVKISHDNHAHENTVYRKKIDIPALIQFLETCNTDTRIYIGCDSEKLCVDNVWWADYTTVAVVHVNGNNGCKIFGAVERERDYDSSLERPRMRLMNEVYRVAELYLELDRVIAHDIQVHLDLNKNEIHNSSIVISEAVGYIKGVCGVVPFTKPESWAASYGADRYKSLIDRQYNHGRIAA